MEGATHTAGFTRTNYFTIYVHHSQYSSCNLVNMQGRNKKGVFFSPTFAFPGWSVTLHKAVDLVPPECPVSIYRLTICDIMWDGKAGVGGHD